MTHYDIERTTHREVEKKTGQGIRVRLDSGEDQIENWLQCIMILQESYQGKLNRDQMGGGQIVNGI